VSSVSSEEDVDVSGEILHFPGPPSWAVGSDSGPEAGRGEGWAEISDIVGCESLGEARLDMGGVDCGPTGPWYTRILVCGNVY